MSKLPKDWRICNFSDIVYFQEGPGVRNWQFKDEGIKLINVANIVDGNLDLQKTSRYLDKKEVQHKYFHFLLNEGDYVLASSGVTWGKIAEVKKEHLPLCLNTSVIRIRPLDKAILCQEYLKHFIRSNFFRRQIDRLITGSAQPNFGPAHLKQVLIPLPLIESQKQIAAILNKADELRKKRKLANQKLDELLQSTFVDMFGDPITNQKNWTKKKMEEVMTIKRGGSPRPIEKFLGGDYHWIKIGDATKGNNIYIESTKEKIIAQGLNKTTFLKAGSLIFANCGVSLGFARILKIDGCIHDGWLSFSEIAEDRINKIFLLKALNNITQYFRDIAPDGTQPNLNTQIMKNFEIIIPPIALQNKFAQIVEKVEEQKAKNEAQIQKLDDLFNSLLQRAFKGELEVKELVHG